MQYPQTWSTNAVDLVKPGVGFLICVLISASGHETSSDMSSFMMADKNNASYLNEVPLKWDASVRTLLHPRGYMTADKTRSCTFNLDSWPIDARKVLL